MSYTGILIGGITFIIIGIFHPIVIKTEYYFSSKVWGIFLLIGILLLILSALTKNDILSILFGILGFTSLWSIKELKEQETRVQKGWYPNNPEKLLHKK